jgi:hypothetical protein
MIAVWMPETRRSNGLSRLTGARCNNVLVRYEV